jgi:23S rRNA (cytosine1962-C5)-methyltransferase
VEQAPEAEATPKKKAPVAGRKSNFGSLLDQIEAEQKRIAEEGAQRADQRGGKGKKKGRSEQIVPELEGQDAGEDRYAKMAVHVEKLQRDKVLADARAAVAAYAPTAEMLNCFSYTGGFVLMACASGAASVTQVDISADALALAKKNEALQHYCGTAMEYVEADVFQFLRKCRDEGRRFDFIVLDPPKFAATRGQLMKAARGYKDINLLAMKLLKPYGTLASFSCSGAMDAEFFRTVLAEAAEDAQRSFQIVARTHAGADHPVSLAFPEGEYLKGYVMRAVQ